MGPGRGRLASGSPPPRRLEGERAPTGSSRPIVPRAPLCPLGTPRLHGVPGARAPRPGRRRREGRTHGGTVCAAAARPAPLAPRAGSPPPAGRRWSGRGQPGSNCAAPGRSRSTGLWRRWMGVRGSGGAGSQRPESRRSEGRCPGEAAEGARPPAAGSGVRRAPPPGGAAPSRAIPRRSVVPAARLEAGPERRSGCAPRRARGLPGGRWSRPGALAVPRDLCPPRST